MWCRSRADALSIAVAPPTRPSPTIFSSWTAPSAVHRSFWQRTRERGAKRCASSAGRWSTSRWRVAPRGRALETNGGARSSFGAGGRSASIQRPAPSAQRPELDEILQGRRAQGQQDQEKHGKEK